MERKVTRSVRISGLVPGERIAVVGTVLETDKAGFFILDDGEGRATVLVPSDELLASVEVGSLVRVIGLAIESSEIKAEIVQGMKGLDTSLYSKFLELQNKFKSG